MEITFKLIVAIVLAVIFVAKRVMANHPLVKKYNNYITLAIVLALATLVALEFLDKNIYFVYGSIGLAILATFYVLREEFKKKK